MNNVERLFRDHPEAADFADGYLGYLAQVFARIDREAIAPFIAGARAGPRRRCDGVLLRQRRLGRDGKPFPERPDTLAHGPDEGREPDRQRCGDHRAGNDYGYDRIFVMQLEPLLSEGDVVVAISASGNSPNVVQAIEFANERKAVTVGLTGFDGGRLGELCEIHVHVPSARGEYGPVEDAHMVLDHLVMSYLWEKWAHAVKSEA